MIYKEMTRPTVIKAIVLDYVDLLRERLSNEVATRKVMNKYYGEERIGERDEHVRLRELVTAFLIENGYYDPPGEGNTKTMEDYQEDVEFEIGIVIGQFDIDESVVDMEEFGW